MAHIPKPSIATLAFHHESYNPSDDQHVQPLGFVETHHGHARYRSVDIKLPARPRVPFSRTMGLTAGSGCVEARGPKHNRSQWVATHCVVLPMQVAPKLVPGNAGQLFTKSASPCALTTTRTQPSTLCKLSVQYYEVDLKTVRNTCCPM